MTKQIVYCHFTEIRPEQFEESTAGAAVSPNASRFRVTSECAKADPDSAEIWTEIRALPSKVHQRVAIAALLMLVRVAQGGQPLTQAFDKKALHETHSFRSSVSGKVERIWRLRRGDIRLLFYDAQDRVVLLSTILVKLRDRLTAGERLAAESAVDRFLEARQRRLLRWV